MVDIHIISDSTRLAEKCEELATKPYLAIDTEFLRASSYWPELCLIQFGYQGEGVLIDPLTPELDLSPLLALLHKPDILKVFHAARQDIEIFYRRAASCPISVFDTQIAAMACGFGDAISYEHLVKSLLGKQINKSSQTTDWSKRPLSEPQKLYALSDVTHLCAIYEILSKRLDQEKRRDWVQPEFDALCDPTLYQNPPEQAWRNLKFQIKDPKRQIYVQAIAAWREREAQLLNKPRGWIIRDDLIRTIAIAAANQVPLEKINAMPRALLHSQGGKRLRHALEAADQIDPSSVILKKENSKNIKNDPKLSMLKLLLKMQCERHHVAPKLIATIEQITNFILDPDQDHILNKGFRYELFGKLAHDLLDGEISLALKGGKTEIIKTTPHALMQS